VRGGYPNPSLLGARRRSSEFYQSLVPGEDAIGPIERGLRVNEQIRISPVRVINAEGAMLGVMPTSKALEASREAGLDLVEVAPNERPPVCKIIDYGKFKYTQKKKLSKQKQHQVHVKEIRVRPKTGDHDIEVKVKRAKEFLEAKDKVLVNVLFRGRELAHIDEGRKVMLEVLAALEDVGKVEKTPSMEGKRMTAIVAPRSGGPAWNPVSRVVFQFRPAGRASLRFATVIRSAPGAARPECARSLDKRLLAAPRAGIPCGARPGSSGSGSRSLAGSIDDLAKWRGMSFYAEVENSQRDEKALQGLCDREGEPQAVRVFALE
jgi:translation initiation factor IF-3